MNTTELSTPISPMAASSMPLLSIIVPCYNVSHFVTDSLMSILQTTSPNNFHKVELIIINDGAKDDTPQKIEQFIDTQLKALDIKYRYISQANAGLSQARNNGLALAQGEYVYFFDSDDLLVNGAIDKMLQALQHYHPDMLEFDAQTFIFPHDLQHPKDEPMYQRYFSLIQTMDKDNRLLAVFEQFGWYVWARCYKKSLFTTHEFEPHRYFEDMMIVPYFYLENTHIASIPEVLIGYRQNPNSITANLSLKHLDDIFFALTKAIEYSKRADLTPLQRQALAILIAKIWRTIIMIALKQRIYHKDGSFLTRMFEYKKILKSQYGIKVAWHFWYFFGKISLAVYRSTMRKIGLMPPNLAALPPQTPPT